MMFDQEEKCSVIVTDDNIPVPELPVLRKVGNKIYLVPKSSLEQEST